MLHVRSIRNNLLCPGQDEELKWQGYQSEERVVEVTQGQHIKAPVSGSGPGRREGLTRTTAACPDLADQLAASESDHVSAQRGSVEKAAQLRDGEAQEAISRPTADAAT
eukprot:CAMPEP_0173127014 /NCGR_PEP_ID=MMETSP1102-20130122/57524_1 /TAXON_ID=49646 /ORGANISM="Geminigera sp., Strain Caron Lab Isolate" /LENGTH=108 /DNA_ID=CAMNT_0014036521 /DNA_START=578 /DNA_END=904 /DNA_ORIENTATION=+